MMLFIACLAALMGAPTVMSGAVSNTPDTSNGFHVNVNFDEEMVFGFASNKKGLYELKVEVKYNGTDSFSQHQFYRVWKAGGSNETGETQEVPQVVESCWNVTSNKRYVQASLLNGPTVLCDTFSAGGGWIVFQRRTKGDVDFFRKWNDYRDGFGNLTTDFWMGLEKIHELTKTHQCELRIDFQYKGGNYFAQYEGFSLAAESSQYKLSIGRYSGTAGDSLTNHNGMSFTTVDRDNDKWSKNCAEGYTGAWWYNSCHHSNLNGVWKAGDNKGPRWSELTGTDSAETVEMKFRII